MLKKIAWGTIERLNTHILLLCLLVVKKTRKLQNKHKHNT